MIPNISLDGFSEINPILSSKGHYGHNVLAFLCSISDQNLVLKVNLQYIFESRVNKMESAGHRNIPSAARCLESYTTLENPWKCQTFCICDHESKENPQRFFFFSFALKP